MTILWPTVAFLASCSTSWIALFAVDSTSTIPHTFPWTAEAWQLWATSSLYACCGRKRWVHVLPHALGLRAIALHTASTSSLCRLRPSSMQPFAVSTVRRRVRYVHLLLLPQEPGIRPGQTLYLSCPALLLVRSHPFSIAHVEPASLKQLEGSATQREAAMLRVVLAQAL